MSNQFKQGADTVLEQWLMSDSFVMGPEVSYRMLRDLMAKALSDSWEQGFKDRVKLATMSKKRKRK